MEMNDIMFFNDYRVRKLDDEVSKHHTLVINEAETEDNTWDDYISGLNSNDGQSQTAVSAPSQGGKRRQMTRFNATKFGDKYKRKRDYSDVEAILMKYGATEFPNPFEAYSGNILHMLAELHELKRAADEAKAILTQNQSEIAGVFDALYVHAIYGKHEGDGIENAENMQKISEMLTDNMTADIFTNIYKTVYGNDEKVGQKDLMILHDLYRTNTAWKQARMDLMRFLNA